MLAADDVEELRRWEDKNEKLDAIALGNVQTPPKSTHSTDPFNPIKKRNTRILDTDEPEGVGGGVVVERLHAGLENVGVDGPDLSPFLFRI